MLDREPRRQEPVAGRDFIINYYSLLGLGIDAGPLAVNRAWRKQIKMYHPDRYHGLAPEFVQKAEYMSRVLGQAKEILTDPDKRAAYDISLASWDGPISKDGFPVISDNSLAGGIRLTDKNFDTKLESLRSKAGELVFFDAEMFRSIEEMFNASDNPDLGVVTAYRNILRRKSDYLAMQEIARRKAVGMNTDSVELMGEDYQEKMQKDIEKRRQRWEDELDPDPDNFFGPAKEIDPRLLPSLFRVITSEKAGRLLAGGELLGLPSGNSTDEDKTNAQVEKAQEKPGMEFYLQRFDSQTSAISRLAKEREEVVDKRLKLIKPIYKGPDTQLFEKVIVCIKLPGTEERIPFKRIEEEDGYSIREDAELSTEALDALDDPSKLEGYTTIYVLHEDDLPPIKEIEQVLYAYFEEYDARSKKA